MQVDGDILNRCRVNFLESDVEASEIQGPHAEGESADVFAALPQDLVTDGV
jgi:hypothetical protein